MADLAGYLCTILSVRTDDFDYELPTSAIGLTPAEPRDSARLLVSRDGGVEHQTIAELSQLVGPGDCVVVNNTRVLPARVRFVRETGGKGEVLLLRPDRDGWWEALVRPSAKLPPGSRVQVGDGFEIEFGAALDDGIRLIRPVVSGELVDALETYGEMPLPPYLAEAKFDDPDRYQTVFSRRSASAAAPTAGLHLTDRVLAAMRKRGATICEVELVVGLDTFRPISTENVEDHVIHEEHYSLDADTWETISAAERVIAIGTTTVRCLESAAATGALQGPTRLFITPPYEFGVTDIMVTNFHLPRSSLLVMIEAFMGPGWRDLYTHAIEQGYRFLSFGDAMWLDPTAHRNALGAES